MGYVFMKKTKSIYNNFFDFFSVHPNKILQLRCCHVIFVFFFNQIPILKFWNSIWIRIRIMIFHWKKKELNEVQWYYRHEAQCTKWISNSLNEMKCVQNRTKWVQQKKIYHRIFTHRNDLLISMKYSDNFNMQSVHSGNN